MMVAAWRLVMPLCSLVAASADNCLLCTESTFFERQLKWLLTVKKKCHYRGGYAWVGNAPSAPGEEIFFWRKFFFWSQSNDKKYYNTNQCNFGINEFNLTCEVYKNGKYLVLYLLVSKRKRELYNCLSFSMLLISQVGLN